VYVSPRTPFLSAARRVAKLLAAAQKRASQSVSHATKGRRRGGVDRVVEAALRARESGAGEVVWVKGTGRACEKVLALAEWFRAKGEYAVVLKTGSVWAVDDVVVAGEDEAGEDTRVRQVSCLEVGVRMK